MGNSTDLHVYLTAVKPDSLGGMCEVSVSSETAWSHMAI